jgi:hypothetical protein
MFTPVERGCIHSLREVMLAGSQISTVPDEMIDPHGTYQSAERFSCPARGTLAARRDIEKARLVAGPREVVFSSALVFAALLAVALSLALTFHAALLLLLALLSALAALLVLAVALILALTLHAALLLLLALLSALPALLVLLALAVAVILVLILVGHCWFLSSVCCGEGRNVPHLPTSNVRGRMGFRAPGQKAQQSAEQCTVGCCSVPRMFFPEERT